LITTKSQIDSAVAPVPAPAPPTTPPARRNPFWKRKLASVSRWLHIYLSMASFAILFFFAATGFTLNHQDWFASQQKTLRTRGSLNVQWLQGAVDKLQVVEYLRRKDGIHGAVDDFRIEDSQCTVSFKGPGYEADIVVDRRTGAFDITETRAGFVAIVNDLHKGRDAGQTWSKIIDIAALLMTVVSLTGLILIFFLHKRRLSGLLLLAAGGLSAYLIYVVWVP
jgi:uncharacterized protein